jgi:hypothetical protein
MHLVRTNRRFACSLPVTVTTLHGREFLITADDISNQGLGVMAPPPWEPSDFPTQVVIARGGWSTTLPVNYRVATSGVYVHSAGTAPTPNVVSFALTWKGSAPERRVLEELSREESEEPTREKRIDYLSQELKVLGDHLAGLENAKHSRLQFVLALVAGYLAYLIAPFKAMPEAGASLAIFYALGGIWLSVSILAYTDRYLNFLRIAYRRKGELYRAIEGNRAYMFGHDPHYCVRSYLSVGSAPVLSMAGPPDTKRATGGRASHYYPTLFIFFVQCLFLLGCFHFASLIVRAADNPFVQFMAVLPDNPRSYQSPYFDWHSFMTAFVMFSGFGLIWIQIAGNSCLHYYQAVFEVKRMSPLRRNPRATGGPFRREKPVYRALVFVMKACAVVAVLCFAVYLIPEVRRLQEEPIADALRAAFSPTLALAGTVLFFAAKLIYTKQSLKAEGDAWSNGSIVEWQVRH